MTTPQCPKCKDTGSGFVAFYSAADRLCDCPVGQERRRWANMTVAEQNAEAERIARGFAAEAKARRAARRAARES